MVLGAKLSPSLTPSRFQNVDRGSALAPRPSKASTTPTRPFSTATDNSDVRSACRTHSKQNHEAKTPQADSVKLNSSSCSSPHHKLVSKFTGSQFTYRTQLISPGVQQAFHQIHVSLLGGDVEWGVVGDLPGFLNCETQRLQVLQTACQWASPGDGSLGELTRCSGLLESNSDPCWERRDALRSSRAFTIAKCPFSAAAASGVRA
jgi:hypothetical protein